MKKLRDLTIVIYLLAIVNEAIDAYNVILFYDSQSFLIFYYICLGLLVFGMIIEWYTLMKPSVLTLIIATIFLGLNPLLTVFDDIDFEIIKLPMYVNMFLIVYYAITAERTENE